MLTTMLIQLLTSFGMGAADRVRGDTYDLFGNRLIDKLIYGWLVAGLLQHPFDIVTLPIMLGMLLGMSISWSEAIGPALYARDPDPAKLEWWQRGILARNAWVALIVRGAAWDLCLLPAAYFDARILSVLPAYTLAMPLAVWFARYMEGAQNGPANRSWEAQEFIRGVLAGLIMMIGFWIRSHAE